MLNNVFSSQLLGSAVLPFALICVSQFTRWQRRVQNVGYKWDPANMRARTRARTHALARALSQPIRWHEFTSDQCNIQGTEAVEQ